MDPSTAVRDNALATYLGLVQNIPGSVLTKSYGVTLVRGPGSFSFCNFAFVTEIDPIDIASVVDLLIKNMNECSSFCVFVFSTDTSQELIVRMHLSGFRVRQALKCLVSRHKGPGEDLDLFEHLEKEDRLAVSKFMAGQFFGWMSSDSRKTIALATALSPHRLLSVGPLDELEGATMLVESSGITGIYNLCVKEGRRGLGLGSKIVRTVQAQAGKIGCPVGILCEPGLVSWYQLQNFEQVGSIDVYCFDPDGLDVIIEPRG